MTPLVWHLASWPPLPPSGLVPEAPPPGLFCTSDIDRTAVCLLHGWSCRLYKPQHSTHSNLKLQYCQHKNKYLHSHKQKCWQQIKYWLYCLHQRWFSHSDTWIQYLPSVHLLYLGMSCDVFLMYLKLPPPEIKKEKNQQKAGSRGPLTLLHPAGTWRQHNVNLLGWLWEFMPGSQRQLSIWKAGHAFMGSS